MILNVITLEFYGIPRQRAGVAEMTIEANTVREMLDFVQARCPRLANLIGPNDKLASQYLLSMDGEQFVRNLDEKLIAGRHYLLLSADAGG